MQKISDAIHEIVTGNAFLCYGFRYRLFNLTQVARFIKKTVEARTQKEVTESAILMNLSRQQQHLSEASKKSLPEFNLDKVSIHANLCSITVLKTEETHRSLNKVFALVQEKGGFITITEGMSEITVILEDDYYQMADKLLAIKPTIVNHDIASVTAKFSKRYINTPGLLYRIMHQVTMQNINLVELASTATEFSLFIAQKDVELAFDSIYKAFIKRGINLI